MPTILVVQGWRLFFYLNEGSEPMRVYARKAESQCKFWLNTATGIEITHDSLILVLPERRVHIPWECCSKKLAGATDLERSTCELSPGGYGIHWPLLDEDLSVNGLIRDA